MKRKTKILKPDSKELRKRTIPAQVAAPMVVYVESGIVLASDEVVYANTLEFVKFLNQVHHVAPLSIKMKPIKEFLNDVENGHHKDLDIKGSPVQVMLEEKMKEDPNGLVMYPASYQRIPLN